MPLFSSQLDITWPTDRLSDSCKSRGGRLYSWKTWRKLGCFHRSIVSWTQQLHKVSQRVVVIFIWSNINDRLTKTVFQKHCATSASYITHCIWPVLLYILFFFYVWRQNEWSKSCVFSQWWHYSTPTDGGVLLRSHPHIFIWWDTQAH